jgi:hypothetical protein
MPLLDHFHPPLHGPRRWEGFHLAWATSIAHQLNQDVLPPDYYAEPAKKSIVVDAARLNSYEVSVYQNLSGSELRAAIELISPTDKDCVGRRRAFAAKCAAYLQRGIGLIIIDVVTTHIANLHADFFKMIDVHAESEPWEAPTKLYAIAYRTIPEMYNSRVEIWAEPLAPGKKLPTLPVWLTLDQCVPLRLEESYLATCQSLRISA